MAGPTEEAGKALSTVAGALQSTPALLSLLVLTLAWMAFWAWFAVSLKDRNAAERVWLIKQIEHCQERLDKKGAPE